MAEVPVEDIVALLDEPLDDFVATRNARAKAMKAEGRKDEAAVLAKIRKPSRAVWLLGQLQRAQPEDASDAAAIASDVEAAQSGGGGDLRTLLRELKEAVDGLAQAASKLDGAPAAAEVALSLRPVLSDPDARDAWLEGRLLDLPGESDGGFGGGAPARSSGTRKKKAEPDDGPDPQAVRAAEDAVARAERVAMKARAKRDESAARVADLEARLAALQDDLGEASSRADAAAVAVNTAEAAVDEARGALEELTGSG